MPQTDEVSPSTACCFIGVDLGTSGCRAVAIDGERRLLVEARSVLPEPLRSGSGTVEQEPWLWWEAVVAVLRALTRQLGHHSPQSLCIDGTSGTLLLCAPDGRPLAPARMYNDASSLAESERIARVAPDTSPARGATSSLAKLLQLKDRLDAPPGTLALHQADWVLGALTGRFGVSDWNNCLKLGYDLQTGRWPDWLSRVGIAPVELPDVLAPGADIGALSESAAHATGLPPHTRVAAGTTDSTAAVVAAGALMPGQAVTCLGSTLVLKIVGREPVTAPQFGVYSHRFGGLSLIGGASNSGGAVLRQHFTDARMRRLTAALRPDHPTGLDYYPLPAPGERFPVCDTALQPRLRPRPADEESFFQGLLEGIAAIETAGYRRLRELGAPAPQEVLTIGGGAANQGWTRIRERLLGVPVASARYQEAAYGTAIIALTGRIPA
jgi:sugar (pentulose or hexulose) kinase